MFTPTNSSSFFIKSQRDVVSLWFENFDKDQYVNKKKLVHPQIAKLNSRKS